MVGVRAQHRRGRPAAPRHALEVAGFRVALEVALAREGGQLLSWIGERELRGLSRLGAPVPDGLAHWQLHGREGLVALELDRGTESFGTLVRKIAAYDAWWQRRTYRTLSVGLGLKPRLAVVANESRARRLVTHISRSYGVSGTIAVAPAAVAFARPLGRTWWRSDMKAIGELFG